MLQRHDYAPLFIDKHTIVVGDDELALRAALELSLIAKSVTLVAPTHGKLDNLIGQRLHKANNVLILEGYAAKEVKGDVYARSLVVGKNGDVREWRPTRFSSNWACSRIRICWADWSSWKPMGASRWT